MKWSSIPYLYSSLYSSFSPVSLVSLSLSHIHTTLFCVTVSNISYLSTGQLQATYLQVWTQESCLYLLLKEVAHDTHAALGEPLGFPPSIQGSASPFWHSSLHCPPPQNCDNMLTTEAGHPRNILSSNNSVFILWCTEELLSSHLLGGKVSLSLLFKATCFLSLFSYILF